MVKYMTSNCTGSLRRKRKGAVRVDRILEGGMFVMGTCQAGRAAIQWKYYEKHSKYQEKQDGAGDFRGFVDGGAFRDVLWAAATDFQLAAGERRECAAGSGELSYGADVPSERSGREQSCGYQGGKAGHDFHDSRGRLEPGVAASRGYREAAASVPERACGGGDVRLRDTGRADDISYPG